MLYFRFCYICKKLLATETKYHSGKTVSMDNYKYFAFISYSSKDLEWGKRLQRKLENYRMPATLCSEHGWSRTPIKPVFFAPTDIQPGGLTEEIQERLRASRNLIVICSPHSAKSEWVGKEIAFFHQLGRTKQIYFFIVDGHPNSGDIDTECYNPVINALGIPEILGVNINERIYPLAWLNKERAYVQLISKLLGVEFDSIWHRHNRILVQKSIAWSLGAIAVAVTIFGVIIGSRPVDVSIKMEEVSATNENLPPRGDAIVTLYLENETRTDTLRTQDTSVSFKNLPHRFLKHPIRITADCQDYISVDTTAALSKSIKLNIRRNPYVYGNVNFRIWDLNSEMVVPGVEVEIAGLCAISDKDGRISLFIPLELQRKSYSVTANIPLENNVIILPCGPDDIICVK